MKIHQLHFNFMFYNIFKTILIILININKIISNIPGNDPYVVILFITLFIL